MKYQEKKELVREVVVDGFENEYTPEDIMEVVFTQFNKKGVKFSEIDRLVKDIGKEEGFIKSVKQARQDADELIDKIDTSEGLTYTQLIDHIKTIAADSGATESYVRGELKDRLEADGFKMPKKTRIPGSTGWRAALALAFKNNPDLTPSEAVVAISGCCKNPEDYIRDYFVMVKAAFEFGRDLGRD